MITEEDESSLREEFEEFKRKKKLKAAKEEGKKQDAYFKRRNKEMNEIQKKIIEEHKDRAAQSPSEKMIKDTMRSAAESVVIPDFIGKENPFKARREITGLCHKLFELLTGGEKLTLNLEEDEITAISRKTLENMRQVATYLSNSAHRGSAQHAVIPTVKALQEYRDILY